MPVWPPARPVATTGTPSVFSARATLIPLPPASARPALARWRWPRWKFGTVSVRSIAALSVTVTIIDQGRSSHQPDHETSPSTLCTVRPAYQPIRAARPGRPTAREATRARWPDEAVARPDLDAPDDLPAPHRQRERDRRDDRLRRADCPGGRPAAAASPRRAASVAAPVRQLAPARRCARSSTASTTRYCDEPPGEQRLEVGVALRARRAAEDRRVDRPDVATAHGRDLRPAGRARVARSSRRSRRGRRRAGRSTCGACGRRRSRPSSWRTVCADERDAHRAAARAPSRRARSSTRPSRRARRGGRSASRAGRAPPPSRSSARRTRRSRARPRARARRRRCSPTGSAPPRPARGP